MMMKVQRKNNKVVQIALLFLFVCIGIYADKKEVRVGYGEKYFSIKQAIDDEDNKGYDLVIYVAMGKRGYFDFENARITAKPNQKIEIRPMVDAKSNSTYYVGDREFNIDKDKNVTTTYYMGEGHGRKLKKDGVEGKNEYFIKNHLGSHITTVNEEGTEVGDVYEYYSYGKQKVSYSYSNHAVTKTFTDKELDVYDPDIGLNADGEGLYYFGARYYDADVGIWTATDPLRQFFNPYNYAGNGYNPINSIDPNGLTINDWDVGSDESLDLVTNATDKQWAGFVAYLWERGTGLQSCKIT